MATASRHSCTRNACHGSVLVGIAVLAQLAASPLVAGELVAFNAEQQFADSPEDINRSGSAVPDASKVVYGQAFFSEYNVTTAEDILRRIPGVSAMLDGSDGGGSQRGFGSDGDQILINGRRLAGKSNEISSALRRIQVQNLERVELLRGTSNDIDVRSDGVVVNVILRDGGTTTASGSVKAAAQLNEYGSFELDGAVNYNGELGRLSYFLSAEKISVSDGDRNGYSRRIRDERYFYPTGEILQDRHSEANLDMTEYSFAANSTYDFDNGDRLQLNALFKPESSTEVDQIDFTEFSIDGVPIESGMDIRSRDSGPNDEWELGGTYERGVGGDGSLKILALYNHEGKMATEARDDVSGGELVEVSRNLSDVVETEAILRGSYYWPLTDNQTLEVGGEIARNGLEQTIEVFSDEDDDGIAERIDIFNPSSTVEEIRSELFVNHNWTLSERWTASSSLVAESSELTQSGADLNNSTGFDFVKPRVDIRFTPNPADQLRLKVERTVSQLEFDNFVPEYSIRQDRFSAGNPYLRPQTAWEYELGFEHRLPEDQGVIETRLFYNDIQDLIENTAIDVDGNGDLEPASGNIGDATEYGGELRFSIRMTKLGAPDFIVDGSYLRRWSSVIDPFTGLERRMEKAEKYSTELGIRHDLTDRNLSYGVNYAYDGGGDFRSQWQDFRYVTREPEMTAFVEKRFNTRWTLRFDALSLTRNQRERSRVVYADNATIGSVERREYYKEYRDRRYAVSLTATF